MKHLPALCLSIVLGFAALPARAARRCSAITTRTPTAAPVLRPAMPNWRQATGRAGRLSRQAESPRYDRCYNNGFANSLFCYFAISLFCYFAISLFRYFVFLLFRYFTILLFRYFAISLFCYLAISLFRYFAILLFRYFAIFQKVYKWHF